MVSVVTGVRMVRVDDAKSKTSKVDVVVDSVLCMPLGRAYLRSGWTPVIACRVDSNESSKRVGSRRLLDLE